MTLAELQEALLGLNSYQMDKVSDQVMSYMQLNRELSQTRPTFCPICNDENNHFIKKGFLRGKQRYLCKSCGHKFVYDVNQLTSHSHQSVDAWVTVIEDTLSMVPLDETAEKIDVHHETAFNMRHKLLVYLEDMIAGAKPLDELIEADETYVLNSRKGVKVPDRKARKHGEGASKPGLSDELYCVCVATDRNNNLFAECVNRAKPSGDDLVAALGTRLISGSTILCDGAKSYNKLADFTNCKKVELVGHETYDKVQHLNTVNGVHSRFKEMIRQYKGVASRYLNRYLALLSVIVSFCGKTTAEAGHELRNKLRTVRDNVTYASSQTTGLLEI